MDTLGEHVGDRSSVAIQLGADGPRAGVHPLGQRTDTVLGTNHFRRTHGRTASDPIRVVASELGPIP